MSLHSKITITTTLILIIGGGLLFTLFEWDNPLTLGQYSWGYRILNGFFQSVTTRTAGFASVSQAGLSVPSVMLSIVLMFIGGSSAGTAGGIKTSTAALVFLCIWTVVRGRTRVNVYKRTIPRNLVTRAIAVFAIAMFAVITASILLSIFEGSNLSDSLFETVSALGTVGLTCGISASLSLKGKLLLVLCMYLGRVGPLSLVTAFAYRSTGDQIIYAERDILIG